MKGYALMNILSLDKQVYKSVSGLTSIESLNRNLPLDFNSFLIVNLKPITTNGVGHWTVLHRNCDGAYEWFNSLSWSDSQAEEMLKVLDIDKRDIQFNKKQTQSNVSNTCGIQSCFNIM